MYKSFGWLHIFQIILKAITHVFILNRNVVFTTDGNIKIKKCFKRSSLRRFETHKKNIRNEMQEKQPNLSRKWLKINTAIRISKTFIV